VVVLAVGCRKDSVMENTTVNEPYIVELPPGAPQMVVPPDNPLTVASVTLGKALFFDRRLSRDGTVSCASCHFPDRAFSDTIALSLGVEGRVGMRNSPPLTNLAWHPSFFRDGGVPTLEQQVIAPIHDPVEMDHDIQVAASFLADEEPYAELSELAYGRRMDAWVLSRAIAAYERTLVSGWSRFDRFQQGDLAAMSAQEQQGWALFSSPEVNCIACHSGFDLSDHSFQNIGQYTAYTDPGRERISREPGDHGKFKVPTLRNVALTAPYMHDGAMGTLEEVVDHFASGGSPHPNKSPLLEGFTVTNEERAALVAFLHALTDERSIDRLP
jgi:cytochrome c peroxidase